MQVVLPGDQYLVNLTLNAFCGILLQSILGDKFIIDLAPPVLSDHTPPFFLRLTQWYTLPLNPQLRRLPPHVI